MKTVRFYDPKADQTTLIPPSELSADCVFAVDAKTGKGSWVEAGKLRVNEQILHPPFPADTMRRIAFIRDAVADVYPQTLEQWAESLRKERNPGNEINVWTIVAAAYLRCPATLTAQQKREAFKAILVYSSSKDKDATIHAVSPKSLDRDALLDAMSAYDAILEAVVDAAMRKAGGDAR
jgi:Pyruvate/2-oxoacid:ferredoxin oxidoreductase gamma subunit